MVRLVRKVLVVGPVVLSSFAGGFVAQHSGHVGAAGSAAGYRVVNPNRIFDSRDPGGNQPKLIAGRQVTIQTGQVGSSAVGVNIAMTGTDGAGFLTAWASGARPNTAIINSSQADENISNFAIVPVAADGNTPTATRPPTTRVTGAGVGGRVSRRTREPVTRAGHGPATIGIRRRTDRSPM